MAQCVLLGPLVEVLVGRRISDLTDPAEPRRRRREEEQQGQRLRIDRIDEIVKSFDFGLEDEVKLRIRLVDDSAVGQNTRSVNEPANRPELSSNPRDRRPHRDAVTHVDRVIDDRRSRRLDPLEVELIRARPERRGCPASARAA